MVESWIRARPGHWFLAAPALAGLTRRPMIRSAKPRATTASPPAPSSSARTGSPAGFRLRLRFLRRFRRQSGSTALGAGRDRRIMKAQRQRHAGFDRGGRKRQSSPILDHGIAALQHLEGRQRCPAIGSSRVKSFAPGLWHRAWCGGIKTKAGNASPGVLSGAGRSTGWHRHGLHADRRPDPWRDARPGFDQPARAAGLQPFAPGCRTDAAHGRPVCWRGCLSSAAALAIRAARSRSSAFLTASFKPLRAIVQALFMAISSRRCGFRQATSQPLDAQAALGDEPGRGRVDSPAETAPYWPSRSRRTGTAISAAAVGVGARLSLAKSIRVVSVS